MTDSEVVELERRVAEAEARAERAERALRMAAALIDAALQPPGTPLEASPERRATALDQPR